jgi:signal transduction histidine kinase
VEAEADRMTGLIADLLTLARPGNDPNRQRMHPVSIGTICEQVLERLDRNDNEVESSIPKGLAISGDHRSLERAFYNLLDNASTYATSRIRLVARSHDNNPIVEIEDDGPGIPNSQRLAIFERFARTDESRGRHRSGTGLGLAITRATIVRHDETITADQSPTLEGA